LIASKGSSALDSNKFLGLMIFLVYLIPYLTSESDNKLLDSYLSFGV